MIIAVTESNNVYALNATTGTVIWQRNLGPAVTSGLPCGNINPLGITGTPVVDLASRSLFLDAIDRWRDQEAFYLFAECGHRRHQFRLAGGCGRHRHLQRHDLYFIGAEERGGLALVNGRRLCVILRTRRRLRHSIMAGLSALISIILRMSCLGHDSNRRRDLGTRRRCQ